MQNAAARLVTGTRRRDHITPVLRQLHRLPVRQRVDFKLALLVYKALHDATAAYLVDDCQLVSHAGHRRLRSADIDTCCVPRTNTHTARRSELRSRWTTALEQSASQYSPARQRHWRISSESEVVFVSLTPRRIVTTALMRLLNTLTHSHSLTHSQCTCSHVITSTECHPKCRFRAASAPNRLLYSPDMAPCSDFYILSNIFDSEAKGIHERTDSSLLTTRMLSTLLMDQCQEFFYSGIRSLGKRSVKGVSVAGDYFEK